ncbi:hypothetical protein [Methylovirgula sp. 4M-Z18]|uniref:hypothetical protein n=1 Tax=Methylovirgula sp. 4M-Z18 TaxID=2293567 RepID=UPI0018F33290|nr:hypothetical protein [Methylovirgula sp. 4M-Z18]
MDRAYGEPGALNDRAPALHAFGNLDEGIPVGRIALGGDITLTGSNISADIDQP